MSRHTDPRFLRSRDAILNAARELLRDHGPTAITHAQVAERAGVGRATVYRHWTRVDELLADAMAGVPMPFFDAPTIPTRDWLRAELTTIARQLDLDDVRAVATTLANAALWDQGMDARRQHLAHLLSERLAGALADAHERGELHLHTRAGDAAALLLGPIYFRATLEHDTTDEALTDAVINSVGTWST